MTTYELYKKVASVLTPKYSEALFDYIIHSMDNNSSFLRSRYCYCENALPDIDCGDISTVLLSLNYPFDFNESKDYYEDNPCTLTALKMQLFLYDLSDNEQFRKEAERSASVGFPYPIKVKITDSSFEILPVVNSLKIKKSAKTTHKKLYEYFIE